MKKLFFQRLVKNSLKYDQIYFYHSDFDEHNIVELDKNKDKSKIDRLRFDVVISSDFPKNLSQTDFLKSMEKIGYIKKEISKDIFPEIDKIFIEKTVEESSAYACIAIYNDILVFKNQRKIIGIAKICFGCKQHQIIGTNLNTDNFGQNGDYEKLKALLKL